ncbi:biotin--[acetyl-CoA-carboxylase] ligase [Georgenia alba]|uniref:biotin--[biotin carboxyl-carrier protein] ligase n=1 Tax=Georgenia alba TaxID=2233858 RepID=A0ABW2Q6H7_9MICO
MEFSPVVRVPRAGSTNADLRAAALAEPDAWPHGSVLVADHQDAGRGRSGRSWVTPPGTALTASVLVRPDVPPDRLGWLPLLTGLAVRRACADLLAARPATAVPEIRLKWPNDVLAVGAGTEDVDAWGRDRKLAGILVEVLADVGAIVGIGVNVRQTASDLPVPWATSLALLGADIEPPAVLSAVGHELLPLLARWEAAAGDARAAGLHAEVTAACATVGAQVRTEVPGGDGPAGRAVGLDDDGRLLVVAGVGSEPVALAAGDVVHVRPGTGY